MKIAYAICSIGLGHASRSLPVIKYLVSEGHEVHVIAHGRSLEFFRRSMEGIRIIDLPDYPIEYSESRSSFLPKIIMKSPAIISSLFEEHDEFIRLHRREDFSLIISDNRYGIFAPGVPSFLITHQLRILNPHRIRFFETLSMMYNGYVGKYFDGILVPDFESNSLTGELSHGLRYMEKDKIYYVGPISIYRKKDVPKDIELLALISGPEPQRTIFENIVLREMEKTEKNYFVVLGRPESRMESENVVSFVTPEKLNDLINRSRYILSRSGYSTVMDLFYTGGKPIFVPTPAQPEQEYLAEYLSLRGISASMRQEEFNLSSVDVNGIRGFEGGYDLEKTIKNIMGIIFNK
ncbi:MAG: glycosyltransferase [Aciduliprofundum sp.]|nr:MAG: glycosyltransferase [Aciduliprofundum sp.]